jgi:hypothetical protein
LNLPASAVGLFVFTRCVSILNAVTRALSRLQRLHLSARLRSLRPWEHPPVASGETQVTVPDSFNPSSPVDAGEVVLRPNPQQ